MKTLINLILLVVVIVVVILLIKKPDFLINPEKTNAAAEGFSRFYANFRSSVQQGGSKSNNIVNLRDTSEELIIMLRRREQQVSPANPAWRGEVVRRRFQEGVTLKTALEEYAQQEQMQLFWTLPRDYVIKQFFETNGTLLDSLQQMAITVAPDFTKPVKGFFCPKSRALVITDLDDPFLKQHCLVTGS